MSFPNHLNSAHVLECLAINDGTRAQALCMYPRRYSNPFSRGLSYVQFQMLCVSIFPQCVRYILIAALQLSILRHITVKPVSHGPLHMSRRLTPYIYLFNMILVDSMGSVQTSIDFRKATDSFKTYSKGYDSLLDFKATFPFRWHILKPSSAKYVNPTKSQQT